MSKLIHLIFMLLSISSFAFVPHVKSVTAITTRTHPSILQVSRRYPSEGTEFDVESGPDHHLIDVDHQKLDQLDHLVEVHEVKVDAMNVMALAFLSLSFFLFVMANMSDIGVNCLLASLQNKFS